MATKKAKKPIAKRKPVKEDDESVAGPFDTPFDMCVRGLQRTAEILDPYTPGGMDYVKINVIAFCVILPIVLATSIGINIHYITKK